MISPSSPGINRRFTPSRALEPRAVLARLGLLAGLGGLVLFWIGLASFLSLPSVEDLKTQNPVPTQLMRIRREQAKMKGKPYRLRQVWVPLDRISLHLRRAVLVAEDGNFYRHRGLDDAALQESFWLNLKKEKFVRGGSTITQQVAKNVFLTPRKSLVRKLKELMIARRMEAKLTKSRILEIYLNIAEWGPGVFGAEAAAQTYFKKPADALAVDEAAALAAVLPSPLRHSPVGEGRYLDRRRDWVLRMMAAAGYLPEIEPAAPVEAVLVAEQEPAREEDVDAESEPAEKRAPARRFWLYPTVPKNKTAVLIVESDGPIGEYMQTVLEEHGFAAYVAADSREALTMAMRLSPAWVLVDVDAPGPGIPALCEKFREIPSLSAAAIVALGSKTQTAELAAARQAGAVDTITKPFDTVVFLEKLKK